MPVRTGPEDGARTYFKQGDHDGLCGFYAVLNAFRYLEDATGYHPVPDDWAFFDVAVECLARVPGSGVRVLMNDHRIGGIDQYQIRDLCVILAERMSLNIDVTLVGPRQRMPFKRRYRTLQSRGQAFAMIAARRNGSHWAVVADGELAACRLIDDGLCRNIPLSSIEKRQFASDVAVVLQIGNGNLAT